MHPSHLGALRHAGNQGGLWATDAPQPCSPVSVEDGFHLGDVGLERDGAEFIQLLVVEQ